MKITFLGTSGFEGIPAIFCGCDLCNYARENKGKDVRTRSSIFINNELLVDVSPDALMQAVKSNTDLSKCNKVLLTHTHSDHCDVNHIMQWESIVPPQEQVLRVYMSKTGMEWVNTLIEHYSVYKTEDEKEESKKQFDFRGLDYYESYNVEGYSVSTVKASHPGYGENEYAINYLIEKDGKRFLYGTDTGYYSEESFEYLRGKELDMCILECTWGDTKKEKHPSVHLNLDAVGDMLLKFEEIGIITKTTPIYITHITHHNTLNHEHMQIECDKLGYNVTVAYDGFTAEI